MTNKTPTVAPDSFWSQLKKFLWYLASGKDLESERKKEELKGVLKAIKEEEDNGRNK